MTALIKEAYMVRDNVFMVIDQRAQHIGQMFHLNPHINTA